MVRCHRIVCCALLMLSVFAAAALGQQRADVSRVYTLRHKTPPEAMQLVHELLGNDVQLQADKAPNRIVVRGTERAHRYVLRVIEIVDQPRPTTAPGQPLVVRWYAVPRDQVASKLELVRSRYGRLDAVKFAPDPESNGLIVFAPAEIHSGLRNELAGAASNRVTPVVALQNAERFVAIQRRPEQKIEPLLQQILGARLVRQAGANGTPELVVSGPSGMQVILRPDDKRGGVTVIGPDPLALQIAHLIQAQNAPQAPAQGVVRSVSLRQAKLPKVQEAVDAYRRGHQPRSGAPQVTGPARGDARMQLAQAPPPPAAPPNLPPEAPLPPGGPTDADQTRERLRELGLELDIEILPDLDAIILRGSNRDVNEVLRIIEDIERLSAETVPVIEVYPLKHVSSDALAPMLVAIQKDLLAGRPGRISITSLNTPNALLLIGWGDAILSVRELIEKLDQPVDPSTQLRVFRLRYAPAAATSTTVQEFFSKRTGLGPKITVTPDARSNSLVVQAAPRDMAEVELLVSRLDTSRGEAVNQVRVFKLRHSLATNLATTLQSAIDSQRSGQGGGGGGGAGTGASGAKSHALELLTVDPLGEKVITSGILGDVKITPDARANTLVVSAPAESMELVAALIHRLDDTSGSVAQIKVFHIVNGDAASLVTMLRSLLPSQTGNTQGTNLPKAEGDDSFVPLRYSVEPRTNSIIATGSAGDLAIIEALLLRLDEREVQQRKNLVYRLKNEPADDVAAAINQFLRSERQLQQAAPGTISPFQQIESEVVVVPEPVGNSLIISATPRFFDDIVKLVEKLDAQPPQVLIQVLIAEVALDDTTQFGIEWGLQDSVLFDRSLLGAPIFQNTTTTFGNQQTTQTQTVLAATNTPGFDFNNPLNPDLGNSGSATSLATAAKTGGQALSNFAVGRTSDLGFGGLVLSASSKGLSALLRALQQNQRLDVLSRPQVMTMDNQPAYIQVGQKVPRVVTASFTTFGQTTGTDLYDVGLILGVTPRISPEGMVVMDVDAIKSDLGPEAEGIPIAISATGNVIRSPKINITEAHTTVSSANGETIILGGLITKSEKRILRRVPYLADVPFLGGLFRYDQFTGKRTELLIILTPQVVRSPEDAARLRQAEAARMHWCAADVHAIHGDGEFCDRPNCPTCDSQTPIIYPDLNPRGIQPTPADPEMIPDNSGVLELPEPRSAQKRKGKSILRPTAPTAAAPAIPAPDPALVPNAHMQTKISNTPPPGFMGSSRAGARPPAATAPPAKNAVPAAKSTTPPPEEEPTRAMAYPASRASYLRPN